MPPEDRGTRNQERGGGAGIRHRRARRRPEERANHERWLVSYADLTTLLFAVFTTLYAMSRVDADKLSAMVASMQLAFQTQGVPRSAPLVARKAAADTPIIDRERAAFEGLRTRLASQLRSQGIQDWVDLEIDDRGLVISIREVGSFPVGSADLSPAAQSLLRFIGTLLAEIDNQVRIEGHTDNVPIHTAKFTSNWQLSAARATNVVAFLLQNTGTNPERISVAGYAEYRPRVGNDSEEGRSQNRRVDLVILTQSTKNIEEPQFRATTVAAAAADPPPATAPR